MELALTRSRLIFLLQLLLGLSLLAVLLLRQQLWSQVVVVLGDFNWAYLPLMGLISFLLIGLSSLKWQAFLVERGIQLPLGRYIKLYMIGTFFNNFVPSMVGGDIARSYLLGRQIDSQVRSAASVFLERFTGVIALVVLASSSIIINPSLMGEPLVLLSVTIVGGGSILILFLILLPQFWQDGLARWTDNRIVAWLSQWAARLHENVREIRENPGLFRLALVYSFAFHLLAGVNVYVAALSIGSHPDLLKTLTLTPLVLIVASLPLTPNSIGILEWAYSFYLVPAGLSTEAGLTVAIILRAKNLVVSILGGVLFLWERETLPQSVEIGL